MRMSLEECVAALEQVFDRNVFYDGSVAKISFPTQSEAVQAMAEARRALRTMADVSAGKRDD